MVETKRITAIKTKIKSLISGKYFVQEGFNPNYIITPAGNRLSRVRIMGTIVHKYDSEKFTSITLDDSTSTIRAKSFGISKVLAEFKKGDIIDLIGRAREYNNELYIVAEIATKIDNVNWELLRELEIQEQKKEWEEKRKLVFSLQTQTLDISELQKIAQSHGISPEEVEDIVISETIKEKEEDESVLNREHKLRIIELIERNDSGDGCDYMIILKKSDLSEDIVDSVINELLNEGTCFEPRPGKIKKL